MPNRNIGILKSTPALIACLLALLGCMYLASKSLFLSHQAVDFPYIWLAGQLWSSGIDPYSAAFESAGRELVVDGHSPQTWFYPPNWWPIAVLTAQLPLSNSVTVWRTVSAALLLTSTLALVLARHRFDGEMSVERAAIAVAYGCLMSATPMALSMGQTSLIGFTGVALFIVAHLTEKRLIMGVALALAMLKPQIGLPLVAFVLPATKWWGSIAGAGFASLLFAVSAFSAVEIPRFVSAYLSQLSVHEGLEPNHPLEMTGMRNLLFDAFDITVPSLGLLTTSAAIAGLIGWRARLQSLEKTTLLALLLATVALFAPLHTYDLMIVVPFILLTSSFSLFAQLVIASGMMVIFRANNLAFVTGIYHPDAAINIDSCLASLGLVIVAVGALAEFFKRTSSTRP